MILLRGKLVENRPIDIVRDSWRMITRAAYRAVGLYWVANMLLRHFQPGAASRYGYASRTSAYLMRKHGVNQGVLMAGGVAKKDIGKHLRQMDNESPLVLTGRMKQDVMSQSVVRGFPTRATVYLYGPAYMNVKLANTGYARWQNGKRVEEKKNFARRQPDKAKEMTTVTSAERDELAKVLTQELRAGIAAVRGTRVTE